MRMELQVRNEQALVANFYAAERDIVTAMQLAVRNAADLVQQVVQLTCAIDTGFMRDHVRVYVSPGGLAWQVGWDASDFFAAGLAFYPWFVEFGTRYMAAQPSLGPAYEYVAPIYQAEVADLVGLAVERRRIAA
jgi:HK97 gp10 family phage protein